MATKASSDNVAGLRHARNLAGDLLATLDALAQQHEQSLHQRPDNVITIQAPVDVEPPQLPFVIAEGHADDGAGCAIQPVASLASPDAAPSFSIHAPLLPPCTEPPRSVWSLQAVHEEANGRRTPGEMSDQMKKRMQAVQSGAPDLCSSVPGTANADEENSQGKQSSTCSSDTLGEMVPIVPKTPSHLTPAASNRKKVSVLTTEEEVAVRIMREARSFPKTPARSSGKMGFSRNESLDVPGSRNGSFIGSTRSSLVSRGSVSDSQPGSRRCSILSSNSVLTAADWGQRSVKRCSGNPASRIRMSTNSRQLWQRAIMRARFLAKMQKIGRQSTVGAVESMMSLDDDEPLYFWLSPIWSEQRQRSVRRTTTFNQADEKEEHGDQDDVQSTLADLRERRWYDKLMVHPNNVFRIAWDMAGCILFVYDAIVIPLEFFGFEKSLALLIMSWIIRMYWTMDIPASFFTGRELMTGTYDMNCWHVAKGYAKTWLPADMALVFIEWLEVLGESRQEFGFARLGKMARNLRMLRMFRFLKLMKTVNFPQELKGLAHLFSERVGIIAGIMKIMLCVVWATHFIGCFWYGIGSSAPHSNNWVAQHGYTDDEKGYIYCTAFHWALTQFTGSMDIQAYNVGERLYSIIVLLIAFVISSFAVSSITTSMTRLQIVTAQQSTQFNDLRKYIAATGISKTLAMRIQRSAQSAVDSKQKNMPEENVELLKLVSEPLRIELHYEVNLPALVNHPFFAYYDGKCRAAMRQICHTSLTKLVLHRGDLVFSSGEMPEEPVMFFVVEGQLLYMHNDSAPVHVQAPAWACEAVLWTLWMYHGTMRAKADCSLILLGALSFQKIACQFLGRDGANPIPYAREWLQKMNDSPKSTITDLEDPEMQLHELVKTVFGNRHSRRHSVAPGLF